MITTCQSPIMTQVSVGNYDPTHTTTLRNAFVRAMNKRFIALRGVIRKAIVDEDCFGLEDITTQVMTPPGRKAFAFSRSSDKVESFMRWLRTQMDDGLLQVTEMAQVGLASEAAWTNLYIQDSYQRGVMRARRELKNAGYNVPSIERTGGLAVSMSTPFHMDRVGLLYSRTFSELKGITNAMDQQISRVLAQGIADGDNPRLLARKLTKTIFGKQGDLALTDTLGRFIPAQRRAQMLARTEIIRAHHQATIQEYRNWGLEGVRVKAEWSTAGFGVCPECAALEGKVFSLDQIESMIPLHPNCRCMALPLEVGGAEVKQAELVSETLFSPALSLVEVEKRILKAGVKEVNLKGLKLDYANSVLSSIEKVAEQGKFNLTKLETYRKSSSFNLALYSPSNNSISINLSKLKSFDKILKSYKIISYEDQLIKAKKSIQFIKDNYLNKPNYKQSTVYNRINAFKNEIYSLEQKIKSGELARAHSVSYTTGNGLNAMKSTIFHELGHYRYYKTFKNEYFAWSKARSISEYGRTNISEYFAEWFNQYMTYGENGVPKELLKIFKSI